MLPAAPVLIFRQEPIMGALSTRAVGLRVAATGIRRSDTTVFEVVRARYRQFLARKRLAGGMERSETATDRAQQVSVPERYAGVLAEREGFEPSIELLDPITV
jgi:hypothetical protein